MKDREAGGRSDATRGMLEFAERLIQRGGFFAVTGRLLRERALRGSPETAAVENAERLED